MTVLIRLPLFIIVAVLLAPCTSSRVNVAGSGLVINLDPHPPSGRIITERKRIPFEVSHVRRIAHLPLEADAPPFFWTHEGGQIVWPTVKTATGWGAQSLTVWVGNHTYTLQEVNWENWQASKGGKLRWMELNRSFSEESRRWLNPQGVFEAPVGLKSAPDWMLAPQEDQVAFVYVHRGVRNVAVSELKGALKDGQRDWESAFDPGRYRPVTAWTFECFRPAWSPDGKSLAFFTSYNVEGKEGVFSLAVAPSDRPNAQHGLELIDEVVAPAVMPDSVYGPEWSPDGKLLFFVSSEDLGTLKQPILAVNPLNREVYAVDTEIDGSREVRLSKTGILAFSAHVGEGIDLFLAAITFKKS